MLEVAFVVIVAISAIIIALLIFIARMGRARGQAVNDDNKLSE